MATLSEPPPSDGVEIMNHLSEISRCFFEAFKADEHRMQFLKFLIAILRKDEKGIIDDNFELDQLARILSGEIQTPTYGKKLLVERFANFRGPFLKEKETVRQTAGRGAPRKVITYTLTEAFNDTAVDYARKIVKEGLKFNVSDDELDNFLTREGADFGKRIILFLTDNYWTAWDTLVEGLRRGISAPEEFKIELNNRAPYWALIFIAWKQHSMRPNSSIVKTTFYADSHYILREVDSDEVTQCLAFLVEKKILIEACAAVGGEKNYRLAESSLPALQDYTSSIASARNALTNLVRSRLGAL